jgi:hypothetical protein
VLRTTWATVNARTIATNCLDVFLRFDHGGVELVAKSLSPLVVKSADHNFVESTKFVGQLARASEVNAPGVQRLIGELRNVEPAVRDRFASYAEVAHQRAVLRQAAKEMAQENETSEHVPAAVKIPVVSTPLPQPIPAAESDDSQASPTARRVMLRR